MVEKKPRNKKWKIYIDAYIAQYHNGVVWCGLVR